jgi:hypothetical protein
MGLIPGPANVVPGINVGYNAFLGCNAALESHLQNFSFASQRS